MDRTSAIVRRLSCSVRTEAQAIDVVQPRHRKRASAMWPSAIRAESFSMSPQTGLLTSTMAVASGSSPALRGLQKWSITASLNISESIPNAVPELQRGMNQEQLTQRHRVRMERKERVEMPLQQANLLLSSPILFFYGNNHNVILINHLGEMDFADFRKQLVGIEFGEAVVGVNPAH